MPQNETHTMKVKQLAGLVRGGLLAVVAACLVSCTSTGQLHKAKFSGFLGDYSQLHAGEGDQAQQVYIRPNVPWKIYNKVIIDPVVVYAVEDSALGKLPPEQLQSLVDYLEAALNEQLAKNCKIVKEPGPGIMRLRVALTDAEASRQVIGVISSLTPPGIAISALKKVATGKPTGTGTARVEMEIVDSATGQRLAAGIDAQAGNKRDFLGNLNKWDDARDAFDGWAEKLQQRISELRIAAR